LAGLHIHLPLLIGDIVDLAARYYGGRHTMPSPPFKMAAQIFLAHADLEAKEWYLKSIDLVFFLKPMGKEGRAYEQVSVLEQL
jgi:hypothetical protein